jgi:hypothetical protein
MIARQASQRSLPLLLNTLVHRMLLQGCELTQMRSQLEEEQPQPIRAVYTNHDV